MVMVLVGSKIAPQRTWLLLLFHAIPAMESAHPPVFTHADSQQLLSRVQVTRLRPHAPGLVLEGLQCHTASVYLCLPVFITCLPSHSCVSFTTYRHAFVCQLLADTKQHAIFTKHNNKVCTGKFGTAAGGISLALQEDQRSAAAAGNYDSEVGACAQCGTGASDSILASSCMGLTYKEECNMLQPCDAVFFCSS